MCLPIYTDRIAAREIPRDPTRYTKHTRRARLTRRSASTTSSRAYRSKIGRNRRIVQVSGQAVPWAQAGQGQSQGWRGMEKRALHRDLRDSAREPEKEK